jgi:hypothetical protein
MELYYFLTAELSLYRFVAVLYLRILEVFVHRLAQINYSKASQ